MNTARVGYDPIRDLTYIQGTPYGNYMSGQQERTIPRCPTCGRAENCICDGCTLCDGPKRTPVGMSDAALQRIIEEL